MSHTGEQEQIVTRTLSHPPHHYYEILQVTKTAEETEIKKLYRKLAIKLHPDKNPHPRAAEAFKRLNKAWGVLGDRQKKQIFDSTGTDPDARGISASLSSSNMARGGMPHGFATNDMFNDDIFNMFFGNAGTFGEPGVKFSFGNGIFTFDTYDNRRPRFLRSHGHGPRGPQPSHSQPETTGSWKQLLPILLFIFISAIFSFVSQANSLDYSFNKTTKFNLERKTPNLQVPFYVDEEYITKNNISPQLLRSFDLKVEHLYIQEKRTKCAREQMVQKELFEDAHGWFSTDQAKLQKARDLPMPNCQILHHHNLL